MSLIYQAVNVFATVNCIRYIVRESLPPRNVKGSHHCWEQASRAWSKLIPPGTEHTNLGPVIKLTRGFTWVEAFTVLFIIGEELASTYRRTARTLLHGTTRC